MAEPAPSASAAPRSTSRLIRLREVQHRVGLGRSTIYRWMAEGRFPKPVPLGGHVVAWWQEDIDEWIEALAPERYERDGETGGG